MTFSAFHTQNTAYAMRTVLGRSCYLCYAQGLIMVVNVLDLHMIAAAFAVNGGIGNAGRQQLDCQT